MNYASTLKLIAALLLVYTGLLLIVSWAMPTNAKLFDALQALLGAVSTAFFVYLKSQPPPPNPPTPPLP